MQDVHTSETKDDSSACKAEKYSKCKLCAASCDGNARCRNHYLVEPWSCVLSAVGVRDDVPIWTLRFLEWQFVMFRKDVDDPTPTASAHRVPRPELIENYLQLPVLSDLTSFPSLVSCAAPDLTAWNSRNLSDPSLSPAHKPGRVLSLSYCLFI